MQVWWEREEHIEAEDRRARDAASKAKQKAKDDAEKARKEKEEEGKRLTSTMKAKEKELVEFEARASKAERYAAQRTLVESAHTAAESLATVEGERARESAYEEGVAATQALLAVTKSDDSAARENALAAANVLLKTVQTLRAADSENGTEASAAELREAVAAYTSWVEAVSEPAAKLPSDATRRSYVYAAQAARHAAQTPALAAATTATGRFSEAPRHASNATGSHADGGADGGQAQADAQTAAAELESRAVSAMRELLELVYSDAAVRGTALKEGTDMIRAMDELRPTPAPAAKAADASLEAEAETTATGERGMTEDEVAEAATTEAAEAALLRRRREAVLQFSRWMEAMVEADPGPPPKKPRKKKKEKAKPKAEP